MFRLSFYVFLSLLNGQITLVSYQIRNEKKCISLPVGTFVPLLYHRKPAREGKSIKSLPLIIGYIFFNPLALCQCQQNSKQVNGERLLDATCPRSPDQFYIVILYKRSLGYTVIYSEKQIHRLVWRLHNKALILILYYKLISIDNQSFEIKMA